MGEGKPKEDKPEHFLEVYYPDNISLLAHMLNEAEVSLRRLNDPNDFIAPGVKHKSVRKLKVNSFRCFTEAVVTI
jgi:hypothetical protein